MAQEKEASKNGKAPQVGALMQASFDDFDVFAEAVVAWDLSFFPLDPGGFCADFAQLRFPKSSLLFCSMSQGVAQSGGLPAGCRTIGIPLAGCTPFKWRGYDVDSDVLMIFPRGGELDSRSQAGFQVITLSLEESLLSELAQREGLEWLLETGERVVRPSFSVLRQLRGNAEYLLKQAISDPRTLESRELCSEIEKDLATAALEALASSSLHPVKPMAAERSQILRKAIDVIEARVDEPLLVGDLSEVVGSSARTLRYAFEEKFGVPPKVYLKARRLSHLRRTLHAADPSQTVGELAKGLGFMHLGQLAADYRRMFGELPSESLTQVSFIRAEIEKNQCFSVAAEVITCCKSTVIFLKLNL
jgi:AraC family ethanolamine operon transcriptional activator